MSVRQEHEAGGGGSLTCCVSVSHGPAETEARCGAPTHAASPAPSLRAPVQLVLRSTGTGGAVRERQLNLRLMSSPGIPGDVDEQ